MKSHHLTKVLCLCGVLLCGTFFNANSFENAQPNLLLILSESYDLPYNRELVKSYENNIREEYPNANIMVEFVDLHQFDNSSLFALNKDFLRIKYSSIDLDFIYFDGAKFPNEMYQISQVLPPVPSVFLIMNPEVHIPETLNFRVLRISNNYRRVIESATRLTGRTQVIMLTDNEDPSYVANTDIIKEQIGAAGSSVTFLDFESIAKTINTINNLSQQESTLLVSAPVFFKESDSFVYPAKVLEEISSKIEIPVFVHWNTMVVGDVVGGYVMSASSIAKAISNATSDFAKGVSPDLYSDVPYRNTYNVERLSDFNVPLVRIDENAILINQRKNFFYPLIEESQFLAALLVILTGLIVFQIVMNRRLLFRYQKQMKLTKRDFNLNRRLNSALEGSQISVWQYNFATQEIEFDELFRVHHGIEENVYKLNYETFLQYVFSEDRAEVEMSLLYAVAQCSSLSIEYRIGVQCSAMKSMRLQANYLAQERNGCLIGTAMDISDDKKIIQNLERSRSIAENSTRAKSIFLANLSHEIRTPMNGILGATELLSASNLKYKQDTYIEMLSDSTHRLMRLLSNILDLSKLESETLQLVNSEFDLLGEFQDLIRKYAMHFQSKSLSIDFNHPADFPKYFVGDEMRILQIIDNLVDNAVKYTASGKIEVKFSYQPSMHQNGKGNFICEVSDTGPGITPQNMRRIMNSFEQAYLYHKHHCDGAGLGLTLVQKLCRMMKGNIDIESEVGFGTKFTVMLPLAAVYQKASPDNVVPINATPDLQNKKVLVVDDNEVSRILMAEMISECGGEIQFAENGSEAVRLFVKEHFDVVLMDMMMPVMDGVEATQKIRELENANGADGAIRRTPIITFSANCLQKDKERCFDVGMDAYLTKPVDKESLYRVLYKAAQ